MSCPACHLLMRIAELGTRSRALCPRCGATVTARKRASLERTWALLLGATLLYLPANMLPIMTTTSTGSVRSDTILSGVIHLALTGMWPLALLVFFASLVVPFVKILALAYLCLSVQLRDRRNAVRRTRLYRFVEQIGRWSMVDIYVVTILIALVRLGLIANVEAEPGALFFGLVVVVTMFAAQAFDPRLIWDRRG